MGNEFCTYDTVFDSLGAVLSSIYLIARSFVGCFSSGEW